MERVISVGGKGAQVTDGDYSEALYCLQAVMVLEKLLGEKIPGNHFEAGWIVCGRKRQKQIEKKLLRILMLIRLIYFKIGTGTKHDIRDILVEDCIFCMPDIYPGSVSGISLESCDGTNLSHVTIRNITMDKVVCPLYIVLNMRNENREPYTDEVGKNSYWGGSIDQICIENIHAADAELPSILTGFVAYKKDGTKVRQAIHNITISGFYVMYRDNEEILEIPDEFTEFLTDYPECNAHGDVDAYGIWARHVDNLVMKEICVKPRSSNTRVCNNIVACV